MQEGALECVTETIELLGSLEVLSEEDKAFLSLKANEDAVAMIPALMQSMGTAAAAVGGCKSTDIIMWKTIINDIATKHSDGCNFSSCSVVAATASRAHMSTNSMQKEMEKSAEPQLFFLEIDAIKKLNQKLQ